MADDTDSPAYPLPKLAHDPRFTFGLTLDVAEVLAAHGYPPIRSGLDHVALRQALFTFLYDTETTDPAPLTGEKC